MNIPREQLIEIIVREVLAELQRRGLSVDDPSIDASKPKPVGGGTSARAIIDLKEYRTPVLTEYRLQQLDAAVAEIVIPKGTIITPGANDIIKKRSLIVSSAL